MKRTKLLSSRLTQSRTLAPLVKIIYTGALTTIAAHAQNAQLATPPPPPKWTGSVALGLTVTSGNSDTVLCTLAGRGEKKWKQDELSLGMDGAYGEADSTKNNETLRGFCQYNRIFGEKWYGYGRVEALHDGIADVDYRLTLSPGAGYYFVKTPRTQLSAEVGPGFIYEKQGGTTDSYMTLRLAEKFEYKLNDRARIFQSVEVLPQVDYFENFIVNAELGVEADVTKTWSLRLVLQDTYDNQPASGRKENDLKLIGGIVWKF